MAKARTLDRRRKSIRSIRKITRTMELISRASFSRAMSRAQAAAGYTRRITALVGHLARSGLEIRAPLLQPREHTQTAILLMLTANRGLCGGYNASVFRLGYARWVQWTKDVPDPQLEVSGKRGLSAFRFRRIRPHQAFTHIQDKPKFEEVEVLANRYLEAFAAGRLDRLDVAYTKFESLSRQYAIVETLLPFTALEREEPDSGPATETPYEFLPSAEDILDEIVPTCFKARLFKCFLDAAVSEQVARMLAMKAATENADAMIDHLTMTYNRARQGQITSELLEVISGAEALNQ
jgi:F-type H+-transporting ATPase subunit gamma